MIQSLNFEDTLIFNCVLKNNILRLKRCSLYLSKKEGLTFDLIKDEPNTILRLFSGKNEGEKRATV